MSFSNKVALVTGGSRGIGREICIKLASAGVSVIINYAGNEEAANETLQECKKCNSTCITYKCDISDSVECEKMINYVKNKYERIDILVNNAGITRDNLLMRMSEDEFDSVIQTNLKGTFNCMKYVSKLMIKQKYGRMVNLSSVVGVRGNAGQVNYSASKAGVIGMTKSAAKELAARNITVNAVAPGMIETDMTAILTDKVKDTMISGIPAKRIGSTEDVANAVLFFADDKAGYVTGQVLCVDGGMAV